MSQYWERVERQRLLIRAEQWSRSVKCIHGHSSSSMWYDKDGTNTRKVVDVEYNNGTICRTDCDTNETKWFGERLVGEELIDAYTRLN